MKTRSCANALASLLGFCAIAFCVTVARAGDCEVTPRKDEVATRAADLRLESLLLKHRPYLAVKHGAPEPRSGER